MSTAQVEANWFSRPSDAIRSLMERKGIGIPELIDRAGITHELVRDLFDGTAKINDELAGKLAASLGGTTSFWLKRQENYETRLDKITERAILSSDVSELLSIPAPGRRPRGKLSNDQIKSEVRKRLLYFNVPNLDSWQSRYASTVSCTAFRQSTAFDASEDATLLWLRRGELEADLVSTKPWNPTKLRDSVPQIRKLTLNRHPNVFLQKLKLLCAESGVAVVVVRAPSGCRASGATRMISPTKGMLLLSFRYRSDDQFWFTVFHEIGHLLLHSDGSFIENNTDPNNKKEIEANEFAEACIVPHERRSELLAVRPTKNAILRLSVSLGVAPGLIVGQLQHIGILSHDQFRFLKRNWSWEQIGAAQV